MAILQQNQTQKQQMMQLFNITLTAMQQSQTQHNTEALSNITEIMRLQAEKTHAVTEESC
eukprot:6628323-Ditylum_brightwellii.AAC.1